MWYQPQTQDEDGGSVGVGFMLMATVMKEEGWQDEKWRGKSRYSYKTRELSDFRCTKLSEGHHSEH